MKLQEYVMDKYKGKTGWFIEETKTITNQNRIQNVIANREYLSGMHNVLKTPNMEHNGKVVEPHKIVLNLANQIISWQTSFLLRNEVQVVGNEKVSDRYNEINKRAKFNIKNNEILKMMLVYGECAEYVYYEHGHIKSKVLSPDTYTPIYDRHKQLIALIESYTYDGISYYTIYDEESVSEYSNKGNKVELVSRHATLTGLPIVYHSNTNKDTSMDNQSDLDLWRGILDNLEGLLSKYSSAFYTFLNPLPVVIGQELKGGLNRDVVGQGLNLDDGSEFKYAQAKLDNQTFKGLWSTLMDTLMSVSGTPSIAFGLDTVSNVSEVTVKMLFSLSETKAYENEMAIKEGLYERNEKIRTLLEYSDFTMTDEEYYSLEYIFTYNIPMNDKEIIDNLKVLREINAISMESMLEKNPYVHDMELEKERLIQEGLIVGSKVN